MCMCHSLLAGSFRLWSWSFLRGAVNRTDLPYPLKKEMGFSRVHGQSLKTDTIIILWPNLKAILHYFAKSVSCVSNSQKHTTQDVNMRGEDHRAISKATATARKEPLKRKRVSPKVLPGWLFERSSMFLQVLGSRHWQEPYSPPVSAVSQ